MDIRVTQEMRAVIHLDELKRLNDGWSPTPFFRTIHMLNGEAVQQLWTRAGGVEVEWHLLKGERY